MRIAQIAPLAEPVPPEGYGGTERVVSYVTEELVRRGHHVTLFASGDSRTDAQLVAPTSRALRRDPGAREPVAEHVQELGMVFGQAERFDVIHSHIDYLAFPAARLCRRRPCTRFMATSICHTRSRSSASTPTSHSCR